MAKCEVCGNEYDKSFELVAAGARHTFDSFECAGARSRLRHRPTRYFRDLKSYLLGARSQTSNPASCQTCKNEYPEPENFQNDIQVCDRPRLLAVAHVDEHG